MTLGCAAELSACGGGSKAAPATNLASALVTASTPATQPVAPTSAAVMASAPITASAPAMSSTPAIKIVIYGDDQAAGIAPGQSGFPAIVSPNESAQLQTLLQKQFNDSGIVVIDASTGGTSSSLQNELDGMDGLGVGQPQRMEQSGAQIVIEAHMLNDALAGETLSDYSGYLAQQVQNAKDAGVSLVFEEGSPVCDGNHPQLQTYASAMESVAAQYNVPVIEQYAYANGLAGWSTHMLGCVVPDTTLDAAKAQRDMAIIAPLVKYESGKQ